MVKKNKDTDTPLFDEVRYNELIASINAALAAMEKTMQEFEEIKQDQVKEKKSTARRLTKEAAAVIKSVRKTPRLVKGKAKRKDA
jgi:hypothetical protein